MYKRHFHQRWNFTKVLSLTFRVKIHYWRTKSMDFITDFNKLIKKCSIISLSLSFYFNELLKTVNPVCVVFPFSSLPI